MAEFGLVALHSTVRRESGFHAGSNRNFRDVIQLQNHGSILFRPPQARRSSNVATNAVDANVDELWLLKAKRLPPKPRVWARTSANPDTIPPYLPQILSRPINPIGAVRGRNTSFCRHRPDHRIPHIYQFFLSGRRSPERRISRPTTQQHQT